MHQRDPRNPKAQTEARSRLIQIFRYLRALNQWRNPPQREIDNLLLILWFHDLPVHSCVTVNKAGETTNAGDDDCILRVARPPLTEAPLPPKEIQSWLQEGWQKVDGRALVKPSITDTNGRIIRFADDPRREARFKEWKSIYKQWTETERPARQAMALYEKLYTLHAELEREGERFELVLGDGRLRWRIQEQIFIDYPLLHRRLHLQFYPAVPEFVITEAEPLSELYTAHLQGIPEVNSTAIGSCREELAQENWHPLGGEETSNFFRKVISLLHSRGQFHEHAFAEQTQIPQIIRDPVIFRRPRNIGMSTALENILEDLPLQADLPYALTSLTGDNDIHTNEKQETGHGLSSPSSDNEDENILLSKPANAEQLEIARRLDKYGAVLVQGPPGTGKTHTIANLIGNLLAQGKSVLVTSEKPKALRVLREKVVGPLQPLCVSMLDDNSNQHMTSTIDAISERLASENADRLEREAVVLARQRRELLRQLNETRQMLTEARGAEYRSITIAGKPYLPSEAAQRVFQTRERDGWIPGPVNKGAANPLTKSELVQLYSTNGLLTPQDEREINLFLPDPKRLLSSVDFEQRMREQTRLHTESLRYREDLWFARDVNDLPESLYTLQKQLEQEIEPIKDLTGWNMAAITAGREGGIRRQSWEDLLQEMQQAYQRAEQAELSILKYAPALSADCLPDRIGKVLDEIVAYLQEGGKLGGLKLLTRRDWKIVLEKATVRGKAPENIEEFQTLAAFVQLDACRKNLLDRWQRQMVPLGGPDIHQLGPAPERTIYQFADPLQRRLQWFSQTWSPLETALKKQGFHWEAFLAETPVVLSEYGTILRLRTAVVEKLPAVIAAEVQRRKLKSIELELRSLQIHLERSGGNTNPSDVVRRLHYAITGRDASAYQQAFQALISLYAKRTTRDQRSVLLQKLEMHAPAWANAVRERVGPHGKSELPGDPDDAWLWRQLTDELDYRSKLSLVELQDRIARLNNEIFRVTAELVEKNAWVQQIRRTTLAQRRALQGWRELMKKVGKGTGKRAPRLLTEAQQLIPTCQSAVPVWIMPINAVAKNFDMRKNHFDVVIIDEASQADITALFVAYLGDQIVVVGDDEQVSPMAVGQQTQAINQLIDEHLRGVPLANMYDGKLSIYGLARTTFEPVCLLEHFRCVSPIIQFSNDLSYQGKIRPLRDDSDVHRRPFTVAYAVKSLGKNDKLNKTEADVIVSLLVAATQQPEYEDATFGVISMVGSEQAMYIDRLLQQYISAPEYVKRRILCGDPAQFQGDERDVIFISMVDVAENGPLALRNEDGNEYAWKKRFNVAASRARDQLWVVHSLDPEIDLKPNDIRRKLILHARDQHLRQLALATQEQRTESEFEKQVLQRLVRAGYHVTAQWPVGAYRIDMVVEGNHKRLAVECDGDRWHPQEKLEEDMARQAILERLGWRFIRIRGSQFFRDPDLAMQPVFERLQVLEIHPVGIVTEKQDNLDGKELKDRIIRQADNLRSQWKMQVNSSISASTPVSGPKVNTVIGQNIPRIARALKEPTISGTREPAASLNSSNAFSPRAGTTSPNIPDKMAGNLPSSTLRQNMGQDHLNAYNSSFDLISYLHIRGHQVVDKRKQGSGFWVVGGNELAQVMKFLAEKGYHFKQMPGGLSPNVDGWYIKSF